MKPIASDEDSARLRVSGRPSEELVQDAPHPLDSKQRGFSTMLAVRDLSRSEDFKLYDLFKP